MPGLVLFFIGVIAIIVPNNVAGSISIQDINVDKLIDLVQQQRIQSEESASVSDESGDNSAEEISGDHLLDIISKVIESKGLKKVISNRKERKERPSYVSAKNVDTQQVGNIAQIMEQLMNRESKGEKYRLESHNRGPKKRLPPSRLTWEDAPKKDESGLEDYSKIFVLLNPQALQSGKGQNINKLVSKLLSLSESPANREEQKQKRYKGFAMKQLGRRRNSRENSGEEGPKRGRGNGGGGAGYGHTAIPYIKHRGDNIFEKEN